MTEDEENMMENQSYEIISKKDQLIDQRSDYWNDHLDDLTVSPFNNDKWNEFNSA